MEQNIIKTLNENELGQYVSIFEENKLNSLDLLSDLTEDDYIKLGISLMGDRKKLLKIFNKNDFSENTSRVLPKNGQSVYEQNNQIPIVARKGMRICKRCGNEYSIGSKKCTKCGDPNPIQSGLRLAIGLGTVLIMVLLVYTCTLILGIG